MAGISLQELQSMGGQPISTPTPGPALGQTPTPQGLSASQLQSMGAIPNQSTDNGFLGTHPVLKTLGNLVSVTGLAKGLSQAIFLNFTPEGQDTLKRLQSGEISLDQFNNIVGGGLATPGEVLGSAAQMALTIGTAGLGSAEEATANEATGQLIRGGTKEVAQPLITRIGKQIATGGAIGSTGGAINAVSQGQGMGGIATSALTGAITGGTLGGASELAATGLTKSLGLIRDSIQGTPEEQSVAQSALQEQEKTKVANDWVQPTTINKSAYNGARAVLEKDPEIPNTLVNLGANPFAHIENGIYDTESSAQAIRDNMGAKSSELLRPALKAADASTPLTPVSDVLKSAINYVQNSNNITPDDSETIISQLENKSQALGRKYPDGMKLTDLMNEKISYDKNAGYNPIKSNADNNSAIANRAFGDGARTMLETNASSDIGVKDFNEELAKSYRAADYLDALHGKKAPVSLSQSAVRYISKIAGAKAAGLIGGGDLVSEFIGYHVGGALERLVEDMTNPMRDAFLEDVKSKTSSEAFQKVQDYIDSIQEKANNSIKLPADNENPTINLGPRDTIEAPAGKVTNTNFNRKTGISYVKDLKTGKVRIIQK